MFALASELGLTPVRARDAARKRYLFADGRLQSLPSNPLGLATTGLVSWETKAKVVTEPLRSRAIPEDESIHAYFADRLGASFADRFVDAFVSGIHAGDARQLGLSAAFPRLYAKVASHGSLIRGALGGGGRSDDASNEPRGGRRGTWSLEGGLGALSETLARSLGARLRLDADVRLDRDGDGWRVGDERTRAVAIAAPAFAAATLLARHHAGLASELAGVDHVPMAGVHLLYPRSALTRPLDGFGFLVPRQEGPRTLGCIWSSAMFDVADDHHVAFTSFLGGAHDRDVLALSDEALVETAHGDLVRALGLSSRPSDASVVRHARAIPQMSTAHTARLRRVEVFERETPGLFLTGNWRAGVSMADTVAHANATAARVATFLAAGAAA
jgi:oxygen-dependent protoporphyrinogen oxidase